MANRVNLGSPFNHKMTIRMTDDQFTFLTTFSETLGVSPSDALRMMLNACMVSAQQKGVVQNGKDLETSINSNVE